MRRLLLLSLALTASCKSGIDLDQGRAYACSRDGGDDASQCGAGFRCGLEGICHAVGTAGAWKCQTASDCEAKWTCGLEGTCHDPLVASNYVCTDDTHCAGGWRCGFSGRCLDPSGEALGTRDAKASDVQLIAPKLTTQPPPGGQFAFDPAFFTFRSGSAWVTQSLNGADRFVNDAGTGAAGAVASAGEVAFIIEGSAFSYLDAPTGTRKPLAFPNATPIDAAGGVLRTLSSLASFEVALILAGDGGTSRYVLASRKGMTSDLLPGPPAAIADLASVDGCGVATTPNGLFAGDLTLPTWAPLGVPGFSSGCGMPASFEPLQLRAADGLTAVAGRASAIGAPMQVAVFDTSSFGSGSGTAVRCVPNGPSCTDDRWVPRVGPCEPCESGEGLVDFHPAVDSNGPIAVTECAGSQPGSTSQFYLLRSADVKQGCSRDRVYPLSDLSSVGPDSPNGAMFGRAGKHGQFWFGTTPLDARSVFFDRPAQLLARVGDAGTPAVFAGNVGGKLSSAGIATLNLPFGIDALSGVDGEPSLVVFNRGLIGSLATQELVGQNVSLDAPVIGYLNAADVDLRPPFHAAVGRKPDGGQELIATAFDTLYSGPFYPDPTEDQDRALGSKIKPFPGSAIDSLAPYLEHLPDGGTTLAAWALTSNGLFNVRAESDKRWRALDVPLPPGDAVEVWTEADKGRVGFSDGLVFSLPSRVLLAHALPPEDVAIDYLFACQQTYVLGVYGVYRLSPRPDGIGEWELETLSPDTHTFDPEALGVGRLFALDGRIYLFTSFGGALSFVPTGGCPP